jgi:hypothetical protein
MLPRRTYASDATSAPSRHFPSWTSRGVRLLERIDGEEAEPGEVLAPVRGDAAPRVVRPWFGHRRPTGRKPVTPGPARQVQDGLTVPLDLSTEERQLRCLAQQLAHRSAIRT